MKNKFILTSAILISCANSALAGNYYTSIDAGISLPRVFKNDDYSKKPSKSSLIKLGVGYQFNEKFRSDVTLEFRNRYKYDISITLANQTNPITQKMSSTALLVNNYYDVNKYGMFTPYVTAGLGIAFNKAGDYTMSDFDTISHPGSSLRTDFVTKGKRSKSFAWNVGLGTKMDINNDFGIDIGYRYVDLGKFKTSNSQIIHTGHFDGTIQSTTGYSDPKKYRLRAHELTVGLFYKF